MPQVLPNFSTASATLAPPSPRPAQPSDSSSSFEQALQQAKPKPAAKQQSDPPAKSSQPKSAKSKSSDSTDQKSDKVKTNQADQSDQSDQTDQSDDTEHQSQPQNSGDDQAKTPAKPTDPKKQTGKTQLADVIKVDDATVATAAVVQQTPTTQPQKTDDEPQEQADPKAPTVTKVAALPTKTNDAKKPPDATAPQKASPQDENEQREEQSSQLTDEQLQDDSQADQTEPVATQKKQTTAAAKQIELPEQVPVQQPQTQPQVKAPAKQKQVVDATAAQALAQATSDDDAKSSSDNSSSSKTNSTAHVLDLSPVDPTATKAPTTTTHVQSAPPPAPVKPQEIDFADANHDRIVTSVKSQLLPNGGTMRIRLDPPELGSMQLTVRIVDGAMTASFETTSDQATKLLSHSLGQLKQSLEAQGVSVEKLHVEQAPRDQRSNTSTEKEQHQKTQQDGRSAQQEQQRKELLRRMWAKLGVGDPLDMVA